MGQLLLAVVKMWCSPGNKSRQWLNNADGTFITYVCIPAEIKEPEKRRADVLRLCTRVFKYEMRAGPGSAGRVRRAAGSPRLSTKA